MATRRGEKGEGRARPAEDVGAGPVWPCAGGGAAPPSLTAALGLQQAQQLDAALSTIGAGECQGGGSPSLQPAGKDLLLKRQLIYHSF